MKKHPKQRKEPQKRKGLQKPQKTKQTLQWHPAFYAGIQIELEEEEEHLIFENEHMLGTKPKQIDVLITKKDAGYKIRKNIGQIFRKYNLIEYKSPEDYLCINDFNKVLAYAYLYMADTIHVNEVQSEEISISFVCGRYPHKLIQYLRDKGQTVEKKEIGIYYVYGKEFPVQIIVNPELSKEENLWLSNLTNKINDMESVEQLARAYESRKDNKLYSAVMDILIRANGAKFSEVKGMCEALKELFKEELEERWESGIRQGISQGVSLGALQEREMNLRAIMENLQITAEKAMDVLNIPLEERGKLLAQL